jgi:hypothetical protein
MGALGLPLAPKGTGEVGAEPAAGAVGAAPAAGLVVGAVFLAGEAGAWSGAAGAAVAGSAFAGTTWAGLPRVGATGVGTAVAGATLSGGTVTPGIFWGVGVAWARGVCPARGGSGLIGREGMGSGPLPGTCGAVFAPTAAAAGPVTPSTNPASAAIRQEAAGTMGILRGQSPGMKVGERSGQAASPADLTDKPGVPDRPLRPV